MALSKTSLKSLFFAPVVAVLTLSLSGLAFGQLRIDVSGVGNNQIPIAIANFAGEATPPQDLPQIVRDDLNRSGLFRTVDAGIAPVAESDPIDANAWKARGANAVVAGSARRGPNGQLVVRFMLYDAARNQSLGGREFVIASPNLLRLTAHKIADYVYEQLTGQKGVFSTHIAYVTRTSQTSYSLNIADADGQNVATALRSDQPIISPTWSPDGTKLAYVGFRLKKPVVYVQGIMTGTIVPVSNFLGSNSAPAWSPDGRTLAVVLSRDGNSQIYMINSDGSGAPRRFSHSSGIDTEPFFTPDGQSIYFTSDRGGGAQIYRMPIGGGEATRVTFKGDYNISPRISPDGKSMAFISRRGGKFQLYIMDLASGQELLLTDTSEDESPSFAPNGQMLLYATKIGRGVLAEVSADGSVHERLSNEQAGDVREPAWGPFVQ